METRARRLFGFSTRRLHTLDDESFIPEAAPPELSLVLELAEANAVVAVTALDVFGIVVNAPLDNLDDVPAERTLEGFADLAELLESRRKPGGLSNNDTLEIGFERGIYPYRKRISVQEYENEKLRLQAELLKVQKWVKETGQRIVILFEGRDAAGKGGTIKRFMEHLNPRAAHVVALEKPTMHEAGELLRAADSACYAAKERGRNRVKIYSLDDSTLNLRQGEMHWVAPRDSR